MSRLKRIRVGQRRAWLVLCEILTIVSVAAFAVGAAVTDANAQPPGDQIGTWDGTRLQLDLSRIPQLLNPEEQVITGNRSSDGRCEAPSPKLELPPDQRIIASQVIAIDQSNCSTTWQIGVPADPAGFEFDPGALKSQTEPALHGAAGPIPGGPILKPVALHTGSGYYKAWKVDIAQLTVNSVQSNITWSWDDASNCTTTWSGTTNWYWLDTTGWEPPNPRTSLLVDQGCGFKTVSSSTNYRNQGFCFPFEVNATYTNIEASGSGIGGLSGSGLTAHTGNRKHSAPVLTCGFAA